MSDLCEEDACICGSDDYCPQGEICCGGQCLECPAVADGTAVCDGETCGFVCNDGYVLNQAGTGCDLVVVAVLDNTADYPIVGASVHLVTPPPSSFPTATFSVSGAPLSLSNPLQPDGSACSQVLTVPAGTRFERFRVLVRPQPESILQINFVPSGQPTLTPNSSFTFTYSEGVEGSIRVRFVTPGTEPNCGCVNDGGCLPSHFCNETTEACEPDLPNGELCTRPAMCQSGQCRNGTCGCLSDADCPETRFCNASRDCQNDLPNGEPCDRAAMCRSGACEDGECACVPDCGGRVCGDDGCGGSCGACGGNQACLDGQCVCADGQPCSASCNCFQRVEGNWICVQGGTGIACLTCTSSAECIAAGYDWCNNFAQPECGGSFICARHDGICPG